MGVAAVCCPSTVTTTALSSCSYRPGCSVSQDLSLARPQAGLRRNLSLNGKSSQQQGRVGVRCRRRARVGGVIISAGLPVISSVPVVGPLANAILNPVLLFIVYAAGAYRFYSGFRKTTYADDSASKISMTALWPVLFLTSAAYRSNFKKAIS